MTDATTRSAVFPRQLPPRGAEDALRQDLDHLGVVHSGPEERFDRIVTMACLQFDVSGAGLAMRSGEHPFIKASVGLAPAESRETQALARLAMSDAGTKVIEARRPQIQIGMMAEQQAIRFYAGQPVRAPSGGRVGTLFVVDPQPRPFTQRDQKLLREMVWWVDRELRHSEEFGEAAEVQRQLMPKQSVHIPGYDIAGGYVPCRGVGGDFFDWYPVPGRGWAMSLGDVMGKGIAAAIVMSAAASILRAAGRQYPPAEAVQFADIALREELEHTGRMITLWHGELNPETHVVSYVDAGHGLLLTLRSDGSVRRRPPGMGGLPLGIVPEERRPEIHVPLDPGDTALVFSDGVLDLYDGTIDSIDVLTSEARPIAERGGAQAVVDYFVQRARNTILTDDVTMMAFRRERA